MMTALVIRPLLVTDEADWRRLWRDYLAFYETELPETVYATTFARLTGPDPGEFRGLLALVDGRAAGLTHYLFHRSCWSIADVCYLQDLYAEPAIRGRGIGRALIESVYHAAAEAGAGRVYWMTQTFNTTARQLYDRIADETPFIKYQKVI